MDKNQLPWMVCLAAVGFLLIKLAAATNDLGLVTGDEYWITKALSDPAQGVLNRLHDYAMGRIYAGWKFDILEAMLEMKLLWLRSLLRVVAMMTAVLAMGKFVREWTRCSRSALWALVAAVGWFAVTYSYQAFLSLPTLWLGWAAIWLMGVFALQPDSVLNRVSLLLAYLCAILIHEGNAVFIVWPVIIKWARGGPFFGWTTWRSPLLCGIVLGFYGLFSLLMRSAASIRGGGVYEGGVLAFNPGEAWFAWHVYTLSGLPGLDSWVSRWGEEWLLTPSAWAVRLSMWLTVSDVIGILIMGGLCGWLMSGVRERHGDPKSRGWWSLIAVLGFAAFAPNILLAFTPKYQIWAHQRMWPYYYTSMSYLAWVAMFVCLGKQILGRIPGRHGRRTGMVAVVALVMLIAAAAAATTREAVARFAEAPLMHLDEEGRRLPD